VAEVGVAGLGDRVEVAVDDFVKVAHHNLLETRQEEKRERER
jgi:hypothetical protein